MGRHDEVDRMLRQIRGGFRYRGAVAAAIQGAHKAGCQAFHVEQGAGNRYGIFNMTRQKSTKVLCMRASSKSLAASMSCTSQSGRIRRRRVAIA